MEESLSAVTKLLLAKDHQGQTAWHKAAERNSVEALKAIWGCADKVTSTVRNSLLLSLDKDNQTSWQLAAKVGHIDVVEKL